MNSRFMNAPDMYVLGGRASDKIWRDTAFFHVTANKVDATRQRVSLWATEHDEHVHVTMSKAEARELGEALIAMSNELDN